MSEHTPDRFDEDGNRLQGRPVVFDEPGVWDGFLDLVRSGMTGYKAAEHMGYNRVTLRRYMKRYPERRVEFLEAKKESREEPAMRVLMSEMENADRAADRIAAAKAVLDASQKDLKEVLHHHQHDVKHSVDEETLASIAALQEAAQKRLDAGDVLDVESEEIPYQGEF